MTTTKREVKKENNNKVNTISFYTVSKNARGEDVRDYTIKSGEVQIETKLPAGIDAKSNKVVYRK
jgi:hypothetical protein